MKISVIMSTYNGERYIIEQLDSIRDQTVKADQVLIFDDQSTDRTVSIIADYINKNDLKSWKLIQNSENLGWRANFVHGIDQTTGDYIFTCDQDDVWMLDKIKRMISIINDDESIDLLASAYIEMIDDGLTSMDKNFVKYNTEQLVSKVILPDNILNVPFPGCSYCFRREFWLSIRKYWIETCPHDCLLWRSAVLKGGCYVINEPLFKWRKHDNSAFSKELNTVDVNSELHWRKCEKDELHMLLQYLDETGNEFTTKTLVERNFRWVILRENLLKNEGFNLKKINNILELLRYKDLYNSNKKYLKDVYISLFRRWK